MSVTRAMFGLRTVRIAMPLAQTGRLVLPSIARTLNVSGRRWAGGITATDRRILRQNRVWKIWTGIGTFLVTGAGATVFFLGSPDENTPESDDPVPLQYWNRAVESFSLNKKKMFEWDPNLRLPARDPLIYFKNDYVLVIDVEKTLVYTEWLPEVGFRTKKRPGVDYFLEWALQSFGEVILWSEKDSPDATPIMQKLVKAQLRRLGPDGQPSETGEWQLPFMAPIELYKGHCRPMDDEQGGIAKDIVILNRDPSKVLVLDDNVDSIRCCKENALRIKPWEGDPNDTSLLLSLGLLQAILNSKADVRTLCPRYAEAEDAGFLFDTVNRSRIVEQEQQQHQQQQQQQQQQQPLTEQQGGTQGLPQLKAPVPGAGADDGGGYYFLGIRIY